MRFCDFLNKLKPRFACRNQEIFVTGIFSALCDGDTPVGLTGYDATYRKLLFSGNNKKYNGLSMPIKTHVLENKNKDTFIAYCDESVSLKEYPALCGDLAVEIDTDRSILFEAIYEQFLEFARCKDDNATPVIPDKVYELARLRVTTDTVSAAPFYGGDDFAVITKPRDMTVALQGSIINPKTNEKTCSGVAKKARERAKLDENNTLLEDVLFSSPSAASMFVTGASSNGYAVWKTAEGKTLKDVETSEAEEL